MNLKLQPFLPSGFDPQEGRHLLKETIDLAWPATVESIFVGLASLVDTIMVSTLGTTAIAGDRPDQPAEIYCDCVHRFPERRHHGDHFPPDRRQPAGRRQYLSAASLLMSVLISALVCGLSFLFAGLTSNSRARRRTRLIWRCSISGLSSSASSSAISG